MLFKESLMPNFLFEILIEDMPHGVLPNTSQYIKEQVPTLLTEFGLSYDKIDYFTTPRRLAFHVSGLPTKGSDRIIEQKGPSVKAAYDDNGNPTKALEGFFSSYKVTKQDIEEREIKGQKYIFIQKTESGATLQEILPNVLQKLINGIKFSQPMRWNHLQDVYEFIRPVRGVTAMIDSQVLPLEFFGIPSSNILHAHRQLSPNSITLDHADNYSKTLKDNGCIPSFAERQDIITQKITEYIAPIHGVALLDDELLSILASLTEYPHPLLAEFDKSFLDLPKEVLISEMKVHQKYVPITDQNGDLLPYYIITANIPYDDPITKKNILAGNNRVLRARFADGQFFFDEDSKKGLQYYADQLRSVSFVDGAGSMADKITRMQSVAQKLVAILNVSVDQNDLTEAVSLAKADLSSLMVGEFPELQGVIGYYYAKDKKDEVSLAIKEHYYPMTVDGETMLPTQELSAIVGLADRIDNLFTLYAVGKTVTGSRDPYALRRQTIAIINIIKQYNYQNFSLSALFESVSDLYKPFMTVDISEWQKMIADFFNVRLEGILKSEHYSSDIINSILTQGVDWVLSDIARVSALQDVQKQHSESFTRLVDLYKRISNISKDQTSHDFDESLLTEPAEIELYQAYQSSHQKMSQLSAEGRLLELVNMESIITGFFDAIMVKTGDQKEINRIALLTMLQKLFKEQADFSKLSS